MTRGEQNVLDDANEFVRQTSDLLEDEPQTSGIRPRPVIEVTETTLDTTRFGFNFGPEPSAGVEPGTGPVTPPPPCVCPMDSDTLQVVFAGITNNGCVSFPGFGSFVVNGDPNTSYTLTNDGAGHWQVEITGVFTLDRYGSDVDCSSYIRTDDMNLFVAVGCSSGGTEVSAFLQVGVSTFCNVFHSLDTSPCATTLNGDSPLDGFFEGGTATISII